MNSIISRLRHMASTKLFGRYLLITNTVTAGTLMGTADILTQKFEQSRIMDKEKIPPHNWKRTANMCIIGVVLGPLGHGWYGFLDKLLPTRSPSSIIKKVCLDQLAAGPLITLLFFVGAGALEGQSLEETKQEIKNKFLTVFLIDCSIWPIAQVVNFYYVPSRFRILYVSAITVVWDTFLSFIKYNDGWLVTSSVEI